MNTEELGQNNEKRGRNGRVNGYKNGIAANGAIINGNANGTHNGVGANGHANGHSNGYTNGQPKQKCACGNDHDDHDDIALAAPPRREYASAFEDIDLDTGDIGFGTIADFSEQGMESPLPHVSKLGYKLFDANGNAELSESEKTEMKILAEQKMQELFDILRIDRNDPNSQETPKRLAKMWVDEIFRGRYEAAPKCTVFPNRKNVEELVISKGIGVMSVCSHHWQTISGTCAIGYIPGESVIGLSKLTRIVDWFSRRGQIQEELGEQVAEYLNRLLKPKAVIVVIKSRHYCMIARGVNSEEDKALMITTAVRGSIVDNEALRNEFFTLIA